MTDICPLCHVNFSNVPPEEIFKIDCKCTDSKYHAGCIKLIYDNQIKNNVSIFSCPICRKSTTSIDDMERFLKIKKNFNCESCVNEYYNQIDTLMPLIIITCLCWFVYTRYVMTVLAKSEHNDKVVECNQTYNLMNQTLQNNTFLYDKCLDSAHQFIITHYVLGVFFGMVEFAVSYMIIFVCLHDKIVIPSLIYAFILLVITILWHTISKTKFYDKASGIPSIFDFILYCIGFVIYIFSLIIGGLTYGVFKEHLHTFKNIFTCCHKKLIYKTGYDYEEINDTII